METKGFMGVIMAIIVFLFISTIIVSITGIANDMEYTISQEIHTVDYTTPLDSTNTLEPINAMYIHSMGMTLGSGEDLSALSIGTQVNLYIYFPYYDEYMETSIAYKIYDGLDGSEYYWSAIGGNNIIEDLDVSWSKYDTNYMVISYITTDYNADLRYTITMGSISTEQKDNILDFETTYGVTSYLYSGIDTPDLPLLENEITLSNSFDEITNIDNNGVDLTTDDYTITNNTITFDISVEMIETNDITVDYSSINSANTNVVNLLYLIPILFVGTIILILSKQKV